MITTTIIIINFKTIVIIVIKIIRIIRIIMISLLINSFQIINYL
jgi:hypothetical protein